MGISETKNAAPSAKGHGAETTSKELKASDLYSLMRQAQTIAKELRLTDPSIELMDAIHTVIGILDDLEGDPDFEPELGSVEGIMGRQERWAEGNTDDRELDDEREPDEDFEPSLGSRNPQITNNLYQPPGRIYTGAYLIPSSLSQENWAAGGCDDLEHDPAELGEEEERGFGNPNDPCSDILIKGGS